MSQTSELKVNGEDFLVLNLAPIYKQGLPSTQSCLLNYKSFNKTSNDLLLAANIAATSLATYGVFKADYDKIKHFLAGYVIANTNAGAFQLILPSTMKQRKLVSAALGFGASVLIGTAKEVYDAQHPANHTSDKYDAYATFAGGAAGVITISLTDVQMTFQRKKK